MRKLQQAALAPGVPAARARTPLLAAVDLESRKRLHGHAGGLGVSQDALSQVLCKLPRFQKMRLLVPACTRLQSRTQGGGAKPGLCSTYAPIGVQPMQRSNSGHLDSLIISLLAGYSKAPEFVPLCRRAWSG